MMREVRNFVGGQWEERNGRDTESVYDPATGKDGVRFFTENKVEISRYYSDPNDVGPDVAYSEEASG